MLGSNSVTSSFQAESLVAKGAEELDARVDMTAMIDLVFMLNIFFLVTSLVTALAEIDLPAAKFVSAADMETSVLVSVIAKGKGDRPTVYIGEVGSGELVPDSQLEEQIAAAVQSGLKQGKKDVVIKAEKNVPAGTTVRIGAAVGAASDEVKLYLAVMEKD